MAELPPDSQDFVLIQTILAMYDRQIENQKQMIALLTDTLQQQKALQEHLIKIQANAEPVLND